MTVILCRRNTNCKCETLATKYYY